MNQSIEKYREQYQNYDDEYLVKLRDNAGLNSEAVEALNIELSERGLEIRTEEKTAELEEELFKEKVFVSVKLRVVAKFTNPTDAFIFKGILENNGVEAFVDDHNLAQAHSFMAAALGWVRVQVPEEHLKKALQIKKDYEDGKFTIDEGEYLYDSSIEVISPTQIDGDNDISKKGIYSAPASFEDDYVDTPMIRRIFNSKGFVFYTVFILLILLVLFGANGI